jgi:hypothetical protein
MEETLLKPPISVHMIKCLRELPPQVASETHHDYDTTSYSIQLLQSVISQYLQAQG